MTFVPRVARLLSPRRTVLAPQTAAAPAPQQTIASFPIPIAVSMTIGDPLAPSVRSTTRAYFGRIDDLGIQRLYLGSDENADGLDFTVALGQIVGQQTVQLTTPRAIRSLRIDPEVTELTVPPTQGNVFLEVVGLHSLRPLYATLELLTTEVM